MEIFSNHTIMNQICIKVLNSFPILYFEDF